MLALRRIYTRLTEPKVGGERSVFVSLGLIQLSLNVILSNKLEIHHSHEVTHHVFRFT